MFLGNGNHPDSFNDKIQVMIVPVRDFPLMDPANAIYFLQDSMDGKAFPIQSPEDYITPKS
jgi:hypothetical protein